MTNSCLAVLMAFVAHFQPQIAQNTARQGWMVSGGIHGLATTWVETKDIVAYVKIGTSLDKTEMVCSDSGKVYSVEFDMKPNTLPFRVAK